MVVSKEILYSVMILDYALYGAKVYSKGSLKYEPLEIISLLWC